MNGNHNEMSKRQINSIWKHTSRQHKENNRRKCRKHRQTRDNIRRITGENVGSIDGQEIT